MRPTFAAFLIFPVTIFFLGCTAPESSDSTRNETKIKGYAQNASEVSPVLTGTTIPDVTLNTVDDDSLSLKQLVNGKPTVLIFYRGGWCPYCNRHMAELQEAQTRLTDLGYQILAISADQPEYLQLSRKENELSYTLLSDSDMEASKAFGLAFKVDPATVERYKNNGLDLTQRSGYDHNLLPVPALFLVNPDGLITFQYVNPDYKTRIKSEVLLAAAEAYYPEEL